VSEEILPRVPGSAYVIFCTHIRIDQKNWAASMKLFTILGGGESEAQRSVRCELEFGTRRKLFF